MKMIANDHNLSRLPQTSYGLDLDALVAVEPDILLADELSEKFGLETLPFDLIDRSERDARIRIAELDQRDRQAFHQTLRSMSEQAFAAAIAACAGAKMADERAERLRADARSAAAKRSVNQFALEDIAAQAEMAAAIATLNALAVCHRARGIDAAVSLKLLGVDHCLPFGLVEVI